MSARGEAAAEQVEEIAKAVESARDAAFPSTRKAVQEDFERRRRPLKSAESG